MCGILGFTHKNWIPDPERIRAATATLAHRGPDQSGVFESSVVSMGARRLKIIDLQSGDQPITSDDGDTTIVFNGEVYNHLEVRAELEGLGHRFYSHADTETVLHAFLEWDNASFSRLRGMFSIALWNKSSKRLVLARDRLGIKPLYISRVGEDLFFGSELKAILIHPEIERRLSLAGLDCYLSLNYIPSPWTLVEGIEKLPPGEWLEWSNGEVRRDRYWALPQGRASDITLDAAKEELDSLLQKAVREHLLSDVPLGVWLSGGVDSTTILHYAANASPSRLRTFSISFQGRSFDETPYIRRAVARYGTEHAELDLNPNVDLQGAIEQFAHYSDEPSADAGALPVWFLSKLCKTTTTVALSGEGADELFGGYLTYRADLLAERLRGLHPGLFRLGLRSLQLWPKSNEKIGLDYKLNRFLGGCLLPAARAHFYWNGTFSEKEKDSLLQPRRNPGLDHVVNELRDYPSGGEDLSRYLWIDQKYYLADDILNKSDRMSMAHSVEVRPPFLDHRIVEFAATLPARFKINGSRQKVILKDLMKQKLPPEILARPKMGFDIPAHDWLRGPLLALLRDTLKDGLAAYPDLFRGAAIETVLQRHLEKKVNAGYHLWGLLILFLWMSKWKIQAPAHSVPAAPVLENIGLSI